MSRKTKVNMSRVKNHNIRPYVGFKERTAMWAAPFGTGRVIKAWLINGREQKVLSVSQCKRMGLPIRGWVTEFDCYIKQS